MHPTSWTISAFWALYRGVFVENNTELFLMSVAGLKFEQKYIDELMHQVAFMKEISCSQTQFYTQNHFQKF